MEFTPTRIPEVVVVRPDVFRDDRGYFMESWNAQRFRAAGFDFTFVQDNQSGSARHVLRGLHYQIEKPQGKLVRVVAGEVFDVAVDMRKSSPTFGGWVGVHLSAADRTQLWVPPGFAHGFLALSDCAELLYKCTESYAPEHERVVRWNDSALGIEWPLPDGMAPTLSEKDEAAPGLESAETYA